MDSHTIHPTVNFIVCHDADGAIGLKNGLPWKHTLDSTFFADITRRGAKYTSFLIMGSTTADTFPSGLKGRKIIGVTRCKSRTPRADKLLEDDLAVGWADTDETFDLVARLNRKNIPVYVCGGAWVYSWAREVFHVENYFVTRIDRTYPADVYLDKQTLAITNSVPCWRVYSPLTFAVTTQVIGQTTQAIKPTHWEKPYLDLLAEVISGRTVTGRNGATKCLFGRELRFNLSTAFPLLTTKRVFFRGVVEELLFFLRGDTDSTVLQKKGITLWEPNTSAEFLRARGLDYQPGEMGPMYGYNWRFFGKEYVNKADAESKILDRIQFVELQGTTFEGCDQFKRVLDALWADPHTRRAHMTTYNPQCVDAGVLEPCHGLTTIFHCDLGLDQPAKTYELSCHMTQRSADMVCGVPFNIASYALLVHIMCGLLNSRGSRGVGSSPRRFVPGELIMSLCDVHIYEEHLDVARRQSLRIPQGEPQLTLPTLQYSLDTIRKQDGSPLAFEDVVLRGYDPHFKLEAKMKA